MFYYMEKVTDAAAKARHLQAMMEGMYPGRWAALRPMTAQELKATTILTMPIDEASAKVSAGMPSDPVADQSWPVWAGVLPITQRMGAPQPDPAMPAGIATPAYVAQYRFGQPL